MVVLLLTKMWTSNFKGKNNRIYCLDFAKVLTMFAVIFVHLHTIDDPIRPYINAFALPLFLMVSGLFHKYSDILTAAKRNFKRFIIPAMFFLVLGTFFYSTLYGIETFFSCLWDSIKGMVLGKKMLGNNVIWFLFALFWGNVFLNMVIRRRYSIFLLCIAYVALIILPFPYRIFHISQGLFSFPFYLIGYLIGRTKLLSKLDDYKGTSLATVAFIGIFLLVVGCLLQPFNQGMSMHLCKTGGSIFWVKYPMLYINGFIGAAGILCISAVASKLELTTHIAKELIGVLGLQYLFMLIWDEYIGRDQHHIVSFIGATGIYTLCLIINYFIAKYLPVVLGRSK